MSKKYKNTDNTKSVNKRYTGVTEAVATQSRKAKIEKAHTCEINYLPTGAILKNKSRAVEVQSLQLAVDKRLEKMTGMDRNTLQWNGREQNKLE